MPNVRGHSLLPEAQIAAVRHHVGIVTINHLNQTTHVSCGKEGLHAVVAPDLQPTLIHATKLNEPCIYAQLQQMHVRLGSWCDSAIPHSLLIPPVQCAETAQHERSDAAQRQN